MLGGGDTTYLNDSHTKADSQNNSVICEEPAPHILQAALIKTEKYCVITSQHCVDLCNSKFRK